MKLGPATMVISLPSKWIKTTGLKPGDEIDLEQENNGLMITDVRTNKSKKEKYFEITPENSPDIETILTHLYRQGFDKIVLNKIDEKIENTIKRTVERLMLGFEITIKNKDSWTIENIASPTKEKYDILLNRTFFIIKETINSIIVQIQNKNEKIKIEELKIEQDKYILYCQRNIILGNRENPTIEWELLTFLRHIEHSLYYLSKEIENGLEKDQNLILLMQKMSDYFGKYYNAYNSRNIQTIHEINSLKSKYHFGDCVTLIKKGKNAQIYSYIRETFRLIQVGTSPIFRLILDTT